MSPSESFFHTSNSGSSSNFDETEQQMLQRLQPLLTRTPQDLLAVLLGQAEVNDGPWEWAAPPPLTRAQEEG